MTVKKSKILVPERKKYYRNVNSKIRFRYRKWIYSKAYLLNHSIYSYFTCWEFRILKAGSDQRRTYKTARNYLTVRNSLMLFLERKMYTLENITPALVKSYEEWLKTRVSKNTLGSYMRVFRALWNKAVDEELIDYDIRHNPFRKVYTGVAKTKKRAVSQEVIAMVKDFNLRNVPRGAGLEFSRDLFMFSFYTRGMSFIDMALLKKSDILNGEIGYIRSKTKQPLSIGIEQEILNIIKRWEPKSGPVFLFPIITGEKWDAKQYDREFRKYWEHLNRLSELMGIVPSLTSHCARHSWASLAKRKGIPVSIIKQALGHDSESTTEIYLNELENGLINEANKKVICFSAD